MSNQEAVNWLINITADIGKAEQALDEIRQMLENQVWIPCNKALPEEKKAVYWACNDSGKQFECRWTNASPFSGREIDWDWHWNIFDVPQYSKVVAWMPLPEPYKVEEDET